jgi:hypothetical protein
MGAQSFGISRQRFIACTGIAASAICLGPHRVFGDEESLAVASRNSGASANVAV